MGGGVEEEEIEGGGGGLRGCKRGGWGRERCRGCGGQGEGMAFQWVRGGWMRWPTGAKGRKGPWWPMVAASGLSTRQHAAC